MRAESSGFKRITGFFSTFEAKSRPSANRIVYGGRDFVHLEPTLYLSRAALLYANRRDLKDPYLSPFTATSTTFHRQFL
jgi:hypothetical protein